MPLPQVLLGATSSRIESLTFSLVPTTINSQLSTSTTLILRLFSISGGSLLTEHYLPSSLSVYHSSIPSTPSSTIPFGQVSRTLPSNGGPIWSLASSPLGLYLAIGCDDGFVRIISLRDGNFKHVSTSEFKKSPDGKLDQRNVVEKLEKAKGRILSLAWGNPIKIKKGKNKMEVEKKQSKKGKGSDSDSDSSLDSEDSSSSSDEDEDSDDYFSSWKESLILGGTSRSCGLLWQVSTGRLLSKLSVPKLAKTSNHPSRHSNGNGGSSLVWSCLILPCGTLVLGDSNSRVTFYDSKNHVLLPGGEFRAHGKESDVLSLVASEDGKTVYSGGTDMKVGEISWVGNNREKDGKAKGKIEGKWNHIISRRLHSHDVRALAIDPPMDLFSHSRKQDSTTPLTSRDSSKKLPILVSGGTDYSLILTPAAPSNQPNLTRTKVKSEKKGSEKTETDNHSNETYFNSVSSSFSTLFASSIQRKLPYVPSVNGRSGASSGGSVISFSKENGWIVLKREKGVGIWSMGQKSKEAGGNTLYEKMARKEENEDEDDDEEEKANDENWSKLLEMEFKSHTNLDVVEISHDGNWLVISDLYESKLFQLVKVSTNSRSKVDDDEEEEEFELQPRRVKSFGMAFNPDEESSKLTGPASTCMRFTPDSKRLILATRWDSKIFVLELPSYEKGQSQVQECKILKNWECHVSRYGSETSAGKGKIGDGRAIASNGKINGHTNGTGNGSSSEEETAHDQINGNPTNSNQFISSNSKPLISLLVISPSSKYLFSSDMSRRSYLFNLETLELIKALPSTAIALADAVFLPSFNFTSNQTSKEDQICLLSPNGSLNFHQISTEVSKSSIIEKRRTESLKEGLKSSLGLFRDSASSVIWLEDGVLIISGPTWLLTARFIPSQIIQTSSNKRDNQAEKSNLQESEMEWSIKQTNKYQPLLYVKEMENRNQDRDGSELLVIERPYFDLARNLPPGYNTGTKYGT